MNELTRISDLMKDARAAEERSRAQAKKAEDESEELKNNFSSSDRTIKELQLQV